MKTSQMVAGSVGLGLWIVMMAFTFSWSKRPNEVTKIPLPRLGQAAPVESQAKTLPAAAGPSETKSSSASEPTVAPVTAADSVPSTATTEAADPAAPATSDSWN
jgi:hypothetical protein